MIQLQVNDFIYFDEQVHQIKAIEEDGVILSGMKKYKLPFSSIKPIPVDKRFLEEVLDEPNFIKDRLGIEEDKYKYDPKTGDIIAFSIRVHFIHQLQHVFEYLNKKEEGN